MTTMTMFRQPIRGVCRVCGATTRPWVRAPEEPVRDCLCQDCAGTPADLAHALAWIADTRASPTDRPGIARSALRRHADRERSEAERL